jgi:predicted ribonuclease toxin of YeeF-YezG toxin-antitoxin module
VPAKTAKTAKTAAKGKFKKTKAGGATSKCPLKAKGGVSKKKTGSAAKTKGTYSRPKGFRKGVRDKVWDAAKGKDGKVRDPVSKKTMKKSEDWDMGHKPGYEFRKHAQSAQTRGISRKQFLTEHNDPTHFRPELPSSNRSHQGEDKTTKYKGP